MTVGREGGGTDGDLPFPGRDRYPSQLLLLPPPDAGFRAGGYRTTTFDEIAGRIGPPPNCSLGESSCIRAVLQHHFRAIREILRPPPSRSALFHGVFTSSGEVDSKFADFQAVILEASGALENLETLVAGGSNSSQLDQALVPVAEALNDLMQKLKLQLFYYEEEAVRSTPFLRREIPRGFELLRDSSRIMAQLIPAQGPARATLRLELTSRVPLIRAQSRLYDDSAPPIPPVR